MTTYVEEIKLYQPDGTTLRQAWSVSDKGQAITKEIPWQNSLTYEHIVPGGYGNASFTIFKDEETIDAEIHDVVKYYWNGVKQYEGRIADLQKVLNESNPNSDATRFICRNMVTNDGERLIFDLKESNNGKVSTEIDEILRDCFTNDKYSGKGQDFNIGILANSNVTFTDAATLPSLDVNAFHNKSSLINVIHEQVTKANGTLDLTAVEPYIMYINYLNAFIVKQRETDSSPLATFALATDDFRVKHSVDLEDYAADVDKNIINQIIINGTDYTSTGSQYWTQIQASRASYGTKQHSIDQANLHTDKLQEWVDGKILNLLEPLTTYRIKPRKSKYGMSTTLFFNDSSTVPDGYIEITGVTGGDITAPFKKCTYRSTTSGIDRVIELGEYRPNLDISVLVIAEPITDTKPSLLISFEDNSVDEDHAPAIYECSAPNGFRVRINADDQSLSSPPTVHYSSASVSVSYDETEGAYLTEDIARPTIGDIKTIKVTATNSFGKDMTAYYYVKGVEVSKGGIIPSVIDHDTSADIGTTSAPEYTNDITIETHYKDRFYQVAAADVKFKFYTVAGSLVKTITSVSSPALSESPANSGYFVCITTVAGLGLGYNFYDVTVETTKHENFIDRDGNSHDHTEVVEGAKVRIKLSSSTIKTDVDDHTTRFPKAEQEGNKGWNDGVDDVNANVKFFATGTAPDSGSAGWFSTKDDRYPSNWIRIAADFGGTPDSEFIINNDQSSGQYVYLTFDTDHSTKKGKIRFDQTNSKVEISVNNGVDYVDVATGASDNIQKTVSTVVYKLRVDDSTGSLIFDFDDTDLFEIDLNGLVTVYADILPEADGVRSLGSASKHFAEIHADMLYTTDINETSDNWAIEWDGVNSIAIPHNIAIGFMDG
jgi:hypothetical protein